MKETMIDEDVVNLGVIDYQAGSEQSMAALNAAKTGACVIIMQGGLTGELSVSPVKAILDDEIAGLVDITPLTVFL